MRPVFVPWLASECTISGGAQSVLSKQTQAEIASGKGLHPALAASGTLANSIEMSFWFNGNVFGLVYEIYAGTAPPSVMIDGVAYEVPTFPRADPFHRNGTSLKPRLSGSILSKTLGDGPHYVEMMFPQHTTETRSWNLYGYLLDGDEGYREGARGGAVTVTARTVGNATYANITEDTTSNQDSAYIRKIFFWNNTAGALTLTLSNTSTSGGDFLVKSIAANDTYEFDPGLAFFQDNALYAKGSGAGIVATSVRGY